MQIVNLFWKTKSDGSFVSFALLQIHRYKQVQHKNIYYTVYGISYKESNNSLIAWITTQRRRIIVKSLKGGGIYKHLYLYHCAYGGTYSGTFSNKTTPKNLNSFEICA